MPLVGGGVEMESELQQIRESKRVLKEQIIIIPRFSLC